MNIRGLPAAAVFHRCGRCCWSSVVLSDDPGTSVTAIQQIMAGALPMVPDLRLPWVHVQDIADAHIEAMTSEAAGANRTIVATDPSSLIDVAAVLRERLPEASAKIPRRAMTTWLTWVASVFEPQLRDIRWLIGSAQRFEHGPAEVLLGRPLRSIPDTIEEIPAAATGIVIVADVLTITHIDEVTEVRDAFDNVIHAPHHQYEFADRGR